MGTPFERVNVIVVDGVGCGESEDAQEMFPEDQGSNSLLNASRVQPFDALSLQRMGLEHVPGAEGLKVVSSVPRDEVVGAYGALAPTFPEKGSPEGHQALMGHLVEEPYLVFDKTGIPEDVIALVEASVKEVTGREAIAIRNPGTDDISGTKFINLPEIGDRHHESSDRSNPLYVPTYASSDSLVQIALNQAIVPQVDIEAIGQEVRRRINDAGLRIGRVIMRPFVGDETPNFERVSSDRKDYGVDPDGPTLINHLTDAGVPVHSIGKAADMLNYSGFPKGSLNKLKSDEERVAEVLRRIKEEPQAGFGFVNLVGTDELFGHRRNPKGYVDHVGLMAKTIVEIKRCMGNSDLLIVTSDHGCDPTHEAHTNHTRENTPVLAYSPRMSSAVELGIRGSYADVAATVAEIFGVQNKLQHGESFLKELLAA